MYIFSPRTVSSFRLGALKAREVQISSSLLGQIKVFSTKAETEAPERKPRPLIKSASINSGFDFVSPDGVETEDTKRRKKMSHSLVGENVHGAYSSLKEKDRWRKRPLFSRVGYEVSFQTAHDAASLLVQEARRRDPYQSDFLQAVEDIVYDLVPAIEEKPKLAWIFKQLMEPELFYTFRIPWKDDNHNTRINRGYLIQYSSTLGPYKGGVVFSQNISHGLIRMLGWEQTLKNSLASDVGSFGFGGLKIGADFDPQDKSDNENKRFCSALMGILYPLLKNKHMGTSRDLTLQNFGEIQSSIETDLNVGKKEMKYLREAYDKIVAPQITEHTEEHVHNVQDSHTVTYPELFGSSCYRNESAGYGCDHFAKEALSRHLKKDIKYMKCLITGSGSLSRNIALKLIEFGAKPMTLSDASGFIYAERGFTEHQVKLVESFKLNNGLLADFARTYVRGVEFFPQSQSLNGVFNNQGNLFNRITCDIVFTCVSLNELNVDDAERLEENGCVGVFECMDRAVTANARLVFDDRSILYAPSKAVHSGSAISSGFVNEYISKNNKFPSLQEIDANLATKMKIINAEIAQTAEKYNMAGNINAGANLLSFLKIAEKEFLPRD